MEYRAYFFGNMYLSSIQQGIQAAHVVTELFSYYDHRYPNSNKVEILTEWASQHKTIILLNGGYCSELHDLVKFFDSDDNPYPWRPFCESKDALNDAITSVGIVLPEYIWIGAKQLREGWVECGDMVREAKVTYEDWNNQMALVSYDISDWEFDLICRLNQYGLAK